VQEGDRPELGVSGRAGTGGPEGRTNGAQEDPQDGACDVRVVVEVGAQALGQGQHPLTDGEVGQDVVGEMGGHLGHTPGVAGGADAAALAGEGDQAFMAAVVTTGSGEPVREDAAAEVGPEVLLNPGGDAVAQGLRLGGLRHEGLEVMLDDGVKRGGRGPAWAVAEPRGRPAQAARGLSWRLEESLRRGRRGRHAGACRGEAGAAIGSWALRSSGEERRPLPADLLSLTIARNCARNWACASCPPDPGTA
jgi:hypothetical protein